MKLRFLKICVLWFATILIGACGDSTTQRNYSGSASYGDLVTFSIDSSNNTYSVTNETTGVTETGSYTAMDSAQLSGVKKVTVSGTDFYTVELDSKVIAANFPIGNDQNKISFGVSSDLDNTGKESQFAGDYMWIIMDDEADKEWGTLTVDSGGTWIKNNYSSATDDPVTEFLSGSPFPLTSGDETGTWAINGTHKERLDVTVTGGPQDLTGYAYVAAGGSVFLMDLGAGNGFMLGFQVASTALTVADIAETYKAVDNDGGALNFTINSDGSGTFYHLDSSGTASTGTISSVTAITNLGNMFHGTVDVGSETWDTYLIFVGDIIMYFCFDETDGTFEMYGAGAKT